MDMPYVCEYGAFAAIWGEMTPVAGSRIFTRPPATSCDQGPFMTTRARARVGTELRGGHMPTVRPARRRAAKKAGGKRSHPLENKHKEFL
jgi:hypothetical protein